MFWGTHGFLRASSRRCWPEIPHTGVHVLHYFKSRPGIRLWQSIPFPDRESKPASEIETVLPKVRELVMNAVQAQVWYLDKEARVVRHNAFAEAMTGLTIEQARGWTVMTLAPIVDHWST